VHIDPTLATDEDLDHWVGVPEMVHVMVDSLATAIPFAPTETVSDHIDEMKRLAATTWWQDAPHTKNAV
jgi:hypothetical protein